MLLLLFFMVIYWVMWKIFCKKWREILVIIIFILEGFEFVDIIVLVLFNFEYL